MEKKIALLLVIIMASLSLPSFAIETEGYSVDVTTNLFGNISHNKSIEFAISVSSPLDESLTLSFKAVNEYGIVKHESNKNIAVMSGVESDITANIDVDSYGVYVLKTEIYSGEKLVLVDNTDFSVVKKTEKINDEMGIHTLFHNDEAYYKEYMDEVYSLYNNIGTGIHRDAWAWDRIEKNKGKYRFNTYLQEQYDIFDANGREVLLTLHTGNSYYTGTNQNYATTEAQLQAWYNYCYNLALMSKDLNVTYEVMNEFDMKGTPAEYFNLLKYAYQGIKAGNPNAKVLGMVCSSANVNWMSKVLDIGKEEGNYYLDGIAFHPYAWDMSPDEFNLTQRIADVKQMMINYGIGDKPMWISEVGWYKYVGREKQASYHVRALALNKINDYLDKIIFYRYMYSPTTASDEGFGFIDGINGDTPFSAFPVLPAIANYNDVMTGASYVKTIDDMCYMYKLSDGRNCIMLWRDNQGIVSLDIDSASITQMDMYGNEQTVYGTNGKYSFIASDNITYIIGNFSDAAISETGIGVDRAISYGKNMQYDTATISGGSATIEASENVSAFVYDGNKIAMLNHTEEEGYVNVNVEKDNNCIFTGKVKVEKKPYDEQVIYDINYDDFGRNTSRGVFYDYPDSEPAICFRHTHVGSRELLSPVFNVKPSGDFKISYDLFLTGNADLDVTNYHGGSYINLAGTSKEGYFVFGGNDSYGVKKNYELNKWYRVEAIVNFTNKIIKLYVDGEYIGTSTESYFPDKLYGIRVSVTSDAQMNTFMKNLRVSMPEGNDFGIDNVYVADDNTNIIVEFSDATYDLKDRIGIINSITGKKARISGVEKITPRRFKISFRDPLESNEAYTVYRNGVIDSAWGDLSDDDYTFIANKINQNKCLKAVYNMSDNPRNAVNTVGATGDIVLEFSDALDPASVGGIKLLSALGEVECDKTLVNEKFVILAPEERLSEAERYSVSVKNLTDADGNRIKDNLMNVSVSEEYKSVSAGSYSAQMSKYVIFKDDFESYSPAANAGEHPISFINTGKWTVSKEAQNSHWWGAGHYIYESADNNVLRGDIWQNSTAFSTQARAILSDEAITSGIYEMEFDLCVNNPELNSDATDYSHFSVLLQNDTGDYPVFDIKNSKLLCYNEVQYGEKTQVTDSFKNSLTDATRMKLVVDMDSNKLMLYTAENGGVEEFLFEGQINATLANNGFTRLVFQQYNPGYVQQVDTSSTVDNLVVSRVLENYGSSFTKNGEPFYMGQLSAGDELEMNVNIMAEGDNRSYKAIYACYNGDMLESVNVYDIEITEQQSGVITSTFKVDFPEGESPVLKCMVFDADTVCNPIFPALEK